MSEAAREALVKRQARIQELLPGLEAATVCLQAGGGSGSGVIVSEDGLILTAAHVVEGQTEMTVRFADGRSLTCKVLGLYNPTDAAMAKMIEPGPYDFVPVAPAGSLKEGMTVIATGHPSGYDEQRGIPLRIGHIVSIPGTGLFSCDAPLIGGDSGGPSFNLDGQVVGIHSNITGDMSVNNDVTIDSFLENWESLLAGEIRGGALLEPEEGTDDLVFGAVLVRSTPPRVSKVHPDTPAQWAGIEVGDELVSVNDTPIEDSVLFLRALLQEQFGRQVQLQLARNGETRTVEVELMLRSEAEAEKAKREQESRESSDESDDREQGRAPTRTSPVLITTSFGPPADEDAKDESAKSELERLFEESRRGRGRIQIDRDRLRRLRDELGTRVSKLAPVGGRRWDEWGQQFKAAFRGSVEKYAPSIFPVFVSGRHVAMAVAVDEGGLLVSKASEVEGRRIEIQLGEDERREAEVVRIERNLDLVLLRVPLTETDAPLIAVDLHSHANRASTTGQKGTLCAAIGNNPETPAGFGVVSVGARALNGNTSAYLGVRPEAAEGGARLVEVEPQGPADLGGLRVGDIIESLDDQRIESPEQLVAAVEARLPNAEVRLSIKRGDRWFTLPVTLGDKSKVAAMPGAAEQGTDGMSTAMSRRRWNFTRGIQHDCGIQPKHCGGLLVDLEGNVLGLNIARAGRIKSYALPVEDVAHFIAETPIDEPRLEVERD